MDSDQFNEAYFERGVETEVSLYQNYRWIPDMTIPMVMTMIDYLHIERGAKVLDFGCAKGYVVKAFNLLYRNAWGVDISRYAISKAESSCFLKEGNVVLDTPPQFPESFDYCIAKDVFEHIENIQLHNELKWIREIAKVLFVIVPLGNGVHYNCPIMHRDVTHIHKCSYNWWEHTFMDTGWEVVYRSYRIDGMKDSYYNYPKAHGFFTLTRKR